MMIQVRAEGIWSRGFRRADSCRTGGVLEVEGGCAGDKGHGLGSPRAEVGGAVRAATGHTIY